MCRIGLESVAEHTVFPVKHRLKGRAYVRKTVALRVAKTLRSHPRGGRKPLSFYRPLGLLGDENPMVVSNSAAAILEIDERPTTLIFSLASDSIAPFLSALSTWTDGCQSVILDVLGGSQTTSPDDACFLMDQLIPMLKNHNPAAVAGQRFSADRPVRLTLVANSDVELQAVVLRTL
jgi:vesicle coat complex subunit